LTYVDELTPLEKRMNGGWATDFQYSLGFSLGAGNRIGGVRWGSLAFEQGLGAGWELIAVGDRVASAEVLRDAVTAAKGGTDPIVLVLKRGDEFRTLSFAYHDGLRYPRLVRIDGTRDRLADIFAPRRR
nr:peptidase M61 [Brevundimonas sp.]